jgi:hypothetical protein
MQLDDRDAFFEALTTLAETFDKKISPQLMALYFEVLTDYSLEVLQVAMGQAMTMLRWFPKPVELIELMDGRPEEHAEQAWTQVYAALNSAGTYRSLYCADAVTAETIRLIWRSWPEAATLPRPESDDGPMYQVTHKEFLAAYQRLERRQRDGERFEPYLQGRLEADNSPDKLAAYRQGELVTYLPRTGRPEARPLAQVLPAHPLVALATSETKGLVE